MTINAETGEPVTTAMMEEDLEVYVIAADKEKPEAFSHHV